MKDNDFTPFTVRKIRRDDFKTNLQYQRTLAGFTQAKLSELSGVNIRMIQHYEQGIKDINKAQGITLYKLAKALGCQMEDLIEEIKKAED